MKEFNKDTINQIENLLNIGISLSAEKDHNKVLEKILTEARRITGADAGTLFLKKGDYLEFKLIQNDSLEINQGFDGQEINLPPVQIINETAAGYCALNNKVINIPNVYDSEEFDFTGPRNYDQITGYKTQSMLIAPLVDHENKVIGVLQLINAQNKDNKVIPFAPYYNKVVSSLASQAAVSVNNIRFLEEIENLLKGLVEVMATAIDSRTPYNAQHTLRIARMASGFVDSINENSKGNLADEYFDKDRKEQLLMSAWLHDIGKITIPLSIMDKASRLEEKLDLILMRFNYIEALLNGKLENDSIDRQKKKEIKKELDYLKKARNHIIRANSSNTYVDEDLKEKLKKINNQFYLDENNQKHKWLKDDELKSLSISKGTLTDNERAKIQEHVNIASRLLQPIPFPDRLNRVIDWVKMHHEYLDGSGYPQGLKGEEIPLEPRMLTLLDIYDALVDSDRPYKESKPVSVALDILKSMVDEGKLDGDLLEIFSRFKVWEAVESEDEDSYKIW